MPADQIAALITPAPPVPLTIQQAIAEAIVRVTSREFMLHAGSWIVGAMLAFRDPTSELAMILLGGTPISIAIARTAQKATEQKNETKVAVAQYDALKAVIETNGGSR
jgi:hypothetical protein